MRYASSLELRSPSGSVNVDGEPAVGKPVSSWTSPYGRCRSASSVGGSTTSSPRRSRTSASAVPHSMRFKIWQGGLGIWGAVAFGALGAWIGVRRRGIPLPPFGDAIAPGIALAQAVGRWGNWFNQELFGGPTDLPWGLQISVEHRPSGYLDVETFHPTFLYESLWLLLVAGLVVWADRRWRLGHGRVFASIRCSVHRWAVRH